jgi:multiple sugar transport system ATP-binding protein
MAEIELQSVCKAFQYPVLDRLSLKVPQGEFFVIVGPSGIGKTTLLRCVAGLENLDGGRILFDGKDVTHVPPYLRGAAMTFESYALYPHKTVFENIASPLTAAKIHRNEIYKRVNEVTKLLQISHLLERKPHEISGGQKQRTALGRTLVAKPRVFLFDEPISHLDAKIRAELRMQFHILQELREVATVYVTHDYAEALSLGDRIGVMGEGGLVQIGTGREIFDKPNCLFVAEHLGQPTINVLDGQIHKNKEDLVFEDGEFRIPVSNKILERLKNEAGRNVKIGLRPQFIHCLSEWTPENEKSVYRFQAEVELNEALGSYGVLLIKAMGKSLTVLISPEVHYASGQMVELGLEIERSLYFDAQSGLNLEIDD